MAGSLRSAAEILTENLVIVKTTKCVLVLTTEEVQAMLRKDPATWAKAIRRGKSWRRGEATARRCGEGGSHAAR